MMLPLLPLLAGCFDVEDFFAGATNETYAEATVVGIAASENMDLSATRYADGALAGAYFGRMDGPADVGFASLVTPSNGEIAFEAVDGGGWVAPPFFYVPGEELILQQDGMPVLHTVAAQPAVFPLSPTHTAGAPMVIDLEGQDFDQVLVTLVDLESGVETWDNVPDDISAVSDALDSENPLRVEIPGEAFAGTGTRVLGVAGLSLSEPSDATGVNSLLSAIATGVLSFSSVQIVEE